MPNVQEIKKTFDIPAGVTRSITLTTNLVESDVIVVIMGRRSLTPLNEIDGLGGGWIPCADVHSVRGAQASYTTGKTGAGGVVTLKNTQTINEQHAIIFVLRGLNQPILGGYGYQLVFGSYTPVLNYSEGCIAIAAWFVVSSDSALYLVEENPSTDWVHDMDETEGGLHSPSLIVDHHIGLAPSTTLRARIAHPSTPYNSGGFMLVFGQPIIPVPFKGWGTKL